jgi:hypothetical protein
MRDQADELLATHPEVIVAVSNPAVSSQVGQAAACSGRVVRELGAETTICQRRADWLELAPSGFRPPQRTTPE